MENNDKIVYSVITQGGGIDGRDPSDKPRVKLCSFDKEFAESKITVWDQKELKTEVVDIKKAKVAALKKLSPLDKLVLGLE